MCVQMNVILPEDTSGMIGMAGKSAENYKTLYLLHGLSDDHTIWSRRTSIERYVSNLGMAVVMPSTARCWYSDSPCGKYYTYIAEELPNICRYFFPNMSKRREDTFIAGLSMGGYGAFKIALENPDTFSKAAALSGAMDIVRFAPRFTHVFGEDPKGGKDDLFAIAERHAGDENKPDLFQWCGTEDFLYHENVAMREHLRTLGYNLSYSESPGNHGWGFWDSQIQNVLSWLTEK